MDIKGKRLRLLYSDVLGVERGKYLFGDVADAGHSAFCIGVFPLTTDKEILDVSRQQFDVGLPDVEAFIDRDTLRPGWEEDTIVGIADVQQHGKALEVDPREVLRRAVEPWRAMGLEPMFAFESEFYLLEPGAEGAWRPVELPSHRVYGTGASVDPTGTIDAMVRAAQQCGFPIEGWASEFDTAAYEVNIRYKEVIPAADECFLFRLLVKEIAIKQGKLATFMGRPFNDRGGSGLHLNISFRREDGSNALHDPKARDGLAPMTRECIAGLLAHHEGISAIAAPHTNAYKRLQPDMLNGYWAN
ncbi:MAG TPA: glutamine synthetase, partial [Actinomycetota bacterium]